MRKLLLLTLLPVLCPTVFSQAAGTFTDNRDGQKYKTITIGSRTWMAENLNYKSEESWCYDNVTANCEIHGCLYTWKAAMSACPDSWHLPADEEWKALEQQLGMTLEESDIFLYRGEGKGTMLKSEGAWKHDSTGTRYNSSGFNALPAGFRLFTDGSFTGKGECARWWTSTTETWEGNTYAFRRCLYSDKTGIDRDAATLTLGFSVRCVRNEK